MISLLKQKKITQFHGHRGWAAIFFGESSLDLTTARSTGGDIVVGDQSSAAFPPAEGTPDAKSRWQTAVQDLRQKLNPHEHRIVTAIRGEDALCQTLRLPTTQVEELRQMLDLQIDNFTPLPVEEVVYSFEPLEITNNETLVLVAVAPKAVINQRVEVLETAGFPPEVVAVDVLAVFRSFLRNELLPLDENLNTFVQIGSTAANIIVHTHGVPVAIRSVVLGEGASLGSVESLAALREELQRTLVAAEADQPDREAGRVTLATWNENLRADVEELARGWSGQAQCYTNGSMPSPAASLCVEAVSDARRLNLLPDEWRQRRQRAQRRRRLASGGIVLSVIYLLGLAVFLSLMGVQQSRLNRVKAEIAQNQKAFNDTRELQRLLLTMQKQLDTEYSALEVLREVSVVMPENVKLNGFTFKKDQTVTLKAQAESAAIANDFISELERCRLFSRIAPGQMRTDPGAGGLTKFDVVCTLKSAAPVPVGKTIWR
jgi:hypothetical protein